MSGRGTPLRVLVTRPRGQGAELVRRLREDGFDTVHVPLIEIEPVGDGPVELTGYDWVVVTSPNGARELLRRAAGPLPRVAAIGGATARALGGADLVAETSTQEGLLSALPRPAGRVLFAGAEGARAELPEALDADVLVLYRTRRLAPSLPPADLAVVASASAAEALGALDTSVPVVSIGPETTHAARTAGLHVLAEATTHDLRGLVRAARAAAAVLGGERAG